MYVYIYIYAYIYIYIVTIISMHITIITNYIANILIHKQVVIQGWARLRGLRRWGTLVSGGTTCLAIPV